MITMVGLDELLADLHAEAHMLDGILGDLPTDRWELPTPAIGWAIRDQVSHLAYFDDAAVLAATDPDRFRVSAIELATLGPRYADVIAARYRKMPSAELAVWFRSSRARLCAVLSGLDPQSRMPWYGPDMTVASSATTRVMETWAHGLDIADTLEIPLSPSRRLRHIAHLGVHTFAYSFHNWLMPVPDTEVRVELIAPDGELWVWGPAESESRVTGTALDFCLVVTKRRNLLDTMLQVTGEVAAAWMTIAQAYPGSAGPGRPPAIPKGIV
ncbi:MAG: hypothetical protein JWN03_9087 [Nocardia sp.]|uniref:TIGR03084 family metal-binding protein n=1 Tax=Nocardia sp. TaxID=1821 RepID=UPI002628DA0D|nr:TIGR03084 family metal-binding protein [Nocardia sp.]MCU1648812.1 hypothetical protein [Nocardia sp.]